MRKIRIVVASPNDVQRERRSAERIIRAVAKKEALVDRVETFLWERSVAPGFSRQPLQIGLIDPEARIPESDIVVVLFSARIGTPITPGKHSGTQHEFETALDSWRLTGRPQIMLYFNSAPLMPNTPEEVDQIAALNRFRLNLPKDGLYGIYEGPADFERLFKKHLPLALRRARSKVKVPFIQKDYDKNVCDLLPEDHRQLCVSESPRLYSSFRLENRNQPFLRLKISTTDGHISNPDFENDRNQKRWNSVEHRIYLVRDPIRPFEIQIGEYRARRYGREPREVPFEGVPSGAELETLYPLMLDAGHRWLRVVFAELLSDPDALKFMHSKEPDSAIRSLIARNPSAPDPVKKGSPDFPLKVAALV